MRTWLWTAALGTLFLASVFTFYGVVERFWLIERLTLDQLFWLHVARGVGASVGIGTWTFLNVWRMRSRYDTAFQDAYRQLEADMKQRTRELVEAQAFTEQLFDAVRDRLLVVDGDGTVTKQNRAAENAGVEKALIAVAAEPLPVADREAVGRDGTLFSVDAYPIAEGRLSLVVARDITNAKQLEAQLRNQEKLAALGVLASGIAHDIANPLASMSSELEMLESEQDLASIRRSLGVVQLHIGRISRTLRDMTDFARRRAEETGMVDIATVVEDALRMVRHDPRARRVRISVEMEPGLPPVRVVEDHVVMVLVNLLLNAFDAMPEGGELRVKGAREGGGVHLSVQDSGCGMEESVRRRATEPLFTTKSGGRGTGLGLSVSADVLRSSGGSLQIDSAPGAGTTVHLHLPEVMEASCQSAS